MLILLNLILQAAMEAVLALGDAGAAAAARAEEEVEAAVFQRAFIPKSLSEVLEIFASITCRDLLDISYSSEHLATVSSARLKI